MAHSHTIIVEDGSIVANANSYVTAAELETYADERGVTGLSADSDTRAHLLFKAMDYIETRVFQGQQVDFGVQELVWPRDEVYIEGNLLSKTAIPLMLKRAQCELALAYNSRYDPLAPVEKQVKEEYFAVFKKVYMDNAVDAPILKKVNAWLDPLLSSDGGGLHFRLDRSYG